METGFIKQTVEALFSKMLARAQFEKISDLTDDGFLTLDFSTEEPHLLVGTEGKTILALNHIVRKIFEKECEKREWKKMSFLVDINGYQKKRIQELKNRAQVMAERARFFKSSVECAPMNPYERMIVHSFFTNIADIQTESVGVGKDRRVVIKYVEQLGISL